MSHTKDEILAAAMTLTPEDRALLADTLLESLHPRDQQEIDAAWAEEAERRIDEFEAGRITTVPAEQVLRPRAHRHPS